MQECIWRAWGIRTNLLRKVLGSGMHAAANEVAVHGWNQTSEEIQESIVGKTQKSWQRNEKVDKEEALMWRLHRQQRR
jgi:hypothetical protein